MSLVAYGSSDDSGQSDTDENNTDSNSLRKQIFQTTGANDCEVGKSVLVPDDKFSDSDEDGNSLGGHTASDFDSRLRDLPTPKTLESGKMIETDELEDEVKPKPSQVADVEKPLPRKLRQPVKITIPALPDSDEDDNVPVKKKPRLSSTSGRSGLTSILPAPVHAAKKEAGRILLPYSLTKKTQASTTAAPKKTGFDRINSESIDKSQQLSASLADYGSESDDEDGTGNPVNFFSLDSPFNRTTDSTEKSSSQMVGPSLPPESSDKLHSKSEAGIPTVPLPPTLARTSLSLPAPGKSGNALVNINNVSITQDELSETGHGIDPDAPLTFKGGATSQKKPSNVPTSDNASSSTAAALGTDGSFAERDQNMYYNMPYESMQYPETTDLEGFQQDSEFLRLQGKKQRGKEEINLIDVNADDFTDPSEITKHLTEEQTYQSHKNKDDQPTGQQKRKHQIQYLAFQAKERELELKNQWSHNRQTKKQTQAKYGF